MCTIKGHQSKTHKECPIVNTVTKATIKGRENPVTLVLNHTALVDDETEKESLCQPCDILAHGITLDLNTTCFGGEGGMLIKDEDGEEDFFEFEFNEMEKTLFFSMEKP